jgi:asparagine synthase (glutamine-hydrolysing)
MCGIAGFVNLDGRPADRDLIVAMTRTLRHRGPDGEGFHLDGPVALGHRRLSILDLESGGQPMTSRDSRSWISFNGEIYNFVELRADLERRGHPFATRSDTEVILHAYEERGADCVRDLRGMFAFALWDPAKRSLLLARDRVGIKPLFYFKTPAVMGFASEMKALLAHPAAPRSVDPCALSDFMTHLYIPGPRTPFLGIQKLPPANVLTLAPGGMEMRPYWSLPQAIEERPEAAWREELDATLREAVRIHMRSDVPVGALLSGGIDSSLMVALAAPEAGGPLRTFSVGFQEADHSELPYARSVASRYNTTHTEFILEPKGIDTLPGLIGHFDEPFGDPSAVPTSAIAEVAARHVKVCLSGDGGDEGFAGYNAYRLARRFALADAIPLALRQQTLGRLEPHWPEWARGKGALRFLTLPPADRYVELMGSADRATRAWLLSPDLLHAAQDDPYDRFRDLYRRLAAYDETQRLQRIDMETYLPDDILVKADRTSMLHSLELRVPLLDHKVLELAFRMPTSMKVRGGRSKWILRRTFGDLLPPQILKRGKQGFGIPLSAWLRGDRRALVRDVLTDARTRRRGVLDPAGLDRLLRSSERGGRDLGNEVWSALVLEFWFREVVDHPTGVPAAAVER